MVNLSFKKKDTKNDNQEQENKPVLGAISNLLKKNNPVSSQASSNPTPIKQNNVGSTYHEVTEEQRNGNAQSSAVPKHPVMSDLKPSSGTISLTGRTDNAASISSGFISKKSGEQTEKNQSVKTETKQSSVKQGKNSSISDFIKSLEKNIHIMTYLSEDGCWMPVKAVTLDDIKKIAKECGE